jgi:hypothetical protein
VLCFFLTYLLHGRDNKTLQSGEKEKKTMRVKAFRLVLLVLLLPAVSGCWYAAAVGAGAAIGYYASEKGYKAQSPVTYETPKKQKDEEQH